MIKVPESMMSHELETAMIATLAANQNSMQWAAINVHPEDFLFTNNSAMFRKLLAMDAEQIPINHATLCTAARETPELNLWQTANILALFTDAGPTSNLPYLGTQLREKRALRRLFEGVGEIAQLLVQPAVKPADVIQAAQELIERASKEATPPKPAPSMKQLVGDVVTRIEKRSRHEKDEVGVSTGLRALDKETGMMRAGSTWVIAAEAKGGKSTLAINLLESVSVVNGLRSLFIGLEMPAIENVERMFSSTGNIVAAQIRDGTITEDLYSKVMETAKKLATAPILFRDDLFDLPAIVAAVKQAKMAHPDLFAVFVDYAQLVGDSRGRDENRENEVARVSTAFRRLAMQENLCIILLSQLNDDGKLRESRRLGQDATTIVFIEPDGNNEHTRRLRLIQRNGRRCSFRVAYIGERMKFADLAEGETYDEPKEEPKRSKRARYDQYHQ